MQIHQAQVSVKSRWIILSNYKKNLNINCAVHYVPVKRVSNVIIDGCRNHKQNLDANYGKA